MSQAGDAKILKVTDVPCGDVKWLKLRKIDWQDEDGTKRVWETAERSTRKGDFDAVAIFAILNHPAKPPSTIIIEQFRPPIGNRVIELPAGLVDAGEDAATTALRELYEETGYGRGPDGGEAKVVDVSPIIVSDPGMTSANMKLVTINLTLPSSASAPPEAKLEEGEHIVKRVVALKELYGTLQDYQKKGFAVDAKLWSLAYGMEVGGKYK